MNTLSPNQKQVVSFSLEFDFDKKVDPDLLKKAINACLNEGREVLSAIANQPGDFIKDAPEKDILEMSAVFESLRSTHIELDDNYITRK